MKAKILNLDNEQSGEISLNPDVFGQDLRKDVLNRVVKWQLSKRQEGNHCAKIRSEVRGGKKKPHKQKGTGQARQGSSVAPHMVGGGVAMGPRPRSHAHDLPKKIRKLGLKIALSAKLADGKLVVLKDISIADKKTATLANSLKKIGLKSALVIDADKINDNFRAAVSNIVNIDALPVVGANVYDILRRDVLVLTEQAVRKLEERLA